MILYVVPRFLSIVVGLIRRGILPDIKGLYKGENPFIAAILLSHSHQDHYGLLSYVNPAIPVYMSKGCKELIEVAYFFGQTDYNFGNIAIVKAGRPFKKGNFTIVPYLVDHSAFDALAFLIESEGKRIFYSADFRGHGRRNRTFDNFIKNPPKDIDYLILEGSMICRDLWGYTSERDIENKLARNKSLFKFKSAKITYSEIQAQRYKLVIKDLYTTRNIFARKMGVSNSTLVYSMWEGYLLEVEPFWEKYNVPIIEVHSSGHANIEELQMLVKAMKPKYIIPNHTFYPEKYFEYFGSNIKMVMDNEE